LVQTSDGGYALAGYTNSSGAGNYDFWLVKTDSSGNAQWNKTYGGALRDVARVLMQTSDGGYALAGNTYSFGSGDEDSWLVKTDSSGNAQWNKTYGGMYEDNTYSLVQTTDGGYALAGYTASFGAGGQDFWLIETDASGNAQWNQTCGGTGVEGAYSLVQTSDEGYALAGYTDSFGAGDYDFWLVKLTLTFYIRADGSVDPSTAPIQRNGNVYKLTDDIYTSVDGIVIQRDSIVLDGQGHSLQGAAGTTGIDLSGRTNVTVQNTLIRQFDLGILLTNGTRNFIIGNSISDSSDCGIYLEYASYNTLAGNNMSVRESDGIALYSSTNNTITANSITNSFNLLYGCSIDESPGNFISYNTITACNEAGVRISSSSNNTVANNNVTGSYVGIKFSSCSGNHVYHNNFVNNSLQANVLEGTEAWDEGYPSGGNFWSFWWTIYNGSDIFRGPGQNETGSDGIADIPYTIDSNNKDSYPLMRSWVGSHSTLYDWPMFRYDPTHTGYGGSPPPGTNQTLWNYTTSGYVYSSPAVADGRVYVGSVDHRVYCLDTLTGAQIWNYTTDNCVYSSPAVVYGRVYVGSDDNRTYCLDASTGTQLWNATTGAYVHSPPTVADGRVYVGSIQNGVVYCFDAFAGIQIWNYTTSASVRSSPAVVGGRIYIGSDDGYVYCLDSFTGWLIWKNTAYGCVWSSPAVVDGRVYVGSTDGNRTFCFFASTGEQSWNYTTGGNVYSSPAVADGRVYVGSDDFNVYCLDALSGTRIWNFTTGDMVRSSPAVVGGRVYVGSVDNKTYCLEALTGVQVWNYTTGGNVYSSPAVADGRVYIGSSDYRLYAFGKTITVPGDYETLQKAVDAALPGDTILVASGVYHESVIVSKTVTILGQTGSPPPIFSGGGSGIFMSLLPGASGSTIAGLIITNYDQGIVINASNCKIYSTEMSFMNQDGIVLMGSSTVNNNVYCNIFQSNAVAANFSASSTGNVFYKNMILGNIINSVGLSLESSGNVIYANTIADNQYGINVTAGFNTIYHNNFIDNAYQTVILTAQDNMWDDGYPSGGSFWSDHSGPDNMKGPFQDVPGNDSIVDFEKQIAPSNVDRYPLLKPFNLHDIGITDCSTAKKVVFQGFTMNMTLTILNYGVNNETFIAKSYANATMMASQPFTLAARNVAFVTLVWNTTGFALGKYVINASAGPVLNEMDVHDNNFTGPFVAVSMVGDLTGTIPFVPDGKCDIRDVSAVAKCFGSAPGFPGWNANCDVNNDGKVDIKDISVVARHFGETAP